MFSLRRKKRFSYDLSSQDEPSTNDDGKKTKDRNSLKRCSFKYFTKKTELEDDSNVESKDTKEQSKDTKEQSKDTKEQSKDTKEQSKDTKEQSKDSKEEIQDYTFEKCGVYTGDKDNVDATEKKSSPSIVNSDEAELSPMDNCKDAEKTISKKQSPLLDDRSTSITNGSFDTSNYSLLDEVLSESSSFISTKDDKEE